MLLQVVLIWQLPVLITSDQGCDEKVTLLEIYDKRVICPGSDLLKVAEADKLNNVFNISDASYSKATNTMEVKAVPLCSNLLYYISKITLPLTPENSGRVETIDLNGKKMEVIGNRTVLFKKPLITSALNIKLKVHSEIKSDEFKMNVYGLAPRTRKFQFFTEKRNHSEAKRLCSRLGGYLTSKYDYETKETYWLGLDKLVETQNGIRLVWSDGDTLRTKPVGCFSNFSSSGNYNGETPLVYSDVGKSVQVTQNTDEVHSVLCGFPDARYYTVRHDEACKNSEVDGAEVAPSSSYEITRINSEFPGQRLQVEVCESSSPSFFDREEFCKDGNEKYALTAYGSLQRNNKNDDDDKVCKVSQGEPMVRVHNINGTIQGANRNIVIYKLDTQREIKELLFLISYNVSHERAFLEVKVTCFYPNKSTEEDPYTLYLSLSYERTRDFQVVAYGRSCHTVNISWNSHVHVLDKHIQDVRYSLRINETSPAVAVGEPPLRLHCLTDVPYHIPITWSTINSTNIRNISIDEVGGDFQGRFYVSTLKVVTPGSYRCSYNTHVSQTVLVQEKYTCELEHLKTSHLYQTNHVIFENMKSEYEVFEKTSINCTIGYSSPYQLQCMKGGCFQILHAGNNVPNNTELCGRNVDLKMSELEELYKSQKTDGLSASNDVFSIVKENSFVSKEDKKRVVDFIETIVTDAITAGEAGQTAVTRQNVYTLATLMSEKFDEADTDLTLDSLKTIDYIGREGTPITIAISGVALLSQNTEIRSSEDDITFAMYDKFDPRYMEVSGKPEAGPHDPAVTSISLPSTKGRTWFTVYNSSTVRLDNNSIASHIIGASLEAIPPGFNATITLKKSFYGPNPQCVYWDEENKDWSSKGVTVEIDSDEYVVCKTNHLTNFALLMSRDDSFIPKTHKAILNFISIGGCTVSCICLLLTIIGLSRFQEVRRLTDSKIHINFSVSLLFALLVFLVFIELTEYEIPCLAGAMLLHFLLLTSVCWMFCEALNLYFSTFTTFTNGNHLRLMMGFSWGLPAFVVAMAAINNLENYKRKAGDFCWLDTEPMTYWFGTPVIIIAIVNFVLYILVIKSLAANARLNRQSSITDLKSCFAMIIVLGSTWVFGFFTMLTDVLIFQYMFAISNSLQGFCVFYCYCGSKRHVILSWKESKSNLTPIQDEYTADSRVVTTKVESVTPIRRSPNNNWIMD